MNNNETLADTLAVKTADDILAENDRFRDLVRRMIDFMERKHAVSDHDRALLNEARKAVGESMKEGGEK